MRKERGEGGRKGGREGGREGGEVREVREGGKWEKEGQMMKLGGTEKHLKYQLLHSMMIPKQ